MPDVSAPPPPPRKRRRPAVVCSECRRRKIACDRKTPCEQCRLHNVECVYTNGPLPPPYGRPPRKAVRAGTTAAAAVAAPAVSEIHHSAEKAKKSSSGSSRQNTGPTIGGMAGRSIDAPAGLLSLLDDNPVVPDDGVSLIEDAACGELSTQTCGRLVKTRLFGRSHWMNNLDEFKDTIQILTRLVPPTSGSAISRSIQRCKAIGRSIKENEKRRIAASSPARGDDGNDGNDSNDDREDVSWLVVPPRAVADSLLDLYFDVFEAQFRILHMPTFRREYEVFMDARAAVHATDNANAWSSSSFDTEECTASPHWRRRRRRQGAVFRAKLALVLALGSCFYDDATNRAAAHALHDDLRVAAARAVQVVQAQMQAVAGPHGCGGGLNKHGLGLDTLQVMCLAALARQTAALTPGDDATWLAVGGLLHAAFGLGLNRDPTHFASLSASPGAREMRRRLWATVLELAVQASLDQGLPPLVSADDYDCAPPLNLDDDEFSVDDECADEGTTASASASSVSALSSAAGHPDSVFTHSSIQRLLCRSLPVRLRITKALNGLGAALTYDRALQLSSDLLAACRYEAPTAAVLRAAPRMTDKHTSDGPRMSTADAEKKRAALATLRIAFAEILTRRFHQALHAPFARRADSHVQFFFSRRARLDTALRLLGFLHDNQEGHKDTDDDGSDDDGDDNLCRRLWLIGRGLFKSTLMDATSAVLIELIHALKAADFVPGHDAAEDLTPPQRELYAMARSAVAFAHARIAAGTLNAKGYLFFAGALAQADALLHGRPVVDAIVIASQAAADKAIRTLTRLTTSQGVIVLPFSPVIVASADDLHDDAPTASPTLSRNALDIGRSGDASTAIDAVSMADMSFGTASGAASVFAAGMGNAVENEEACVDRFLGIAGLGGETFETGVDSAIRLASTTQIGSDSCSREPWMDPWALNPRSDLGLGFWALPFDRIDSS